MQKQWPDSREILSTLLPGKIRENSAIFSCICDLPAGELVCSVFQLSCFLLYCLLLGCLVWNNLYKDYVRNPEVFGRMHRHLLVPIKPQRMMILEKKRMNTTVSILNFNFRIFVKYFYLIFWNKYTTFITQIITIWYKTDYLMSYFTYSIKIFFFHWP